MGLCCSQLDLSERRQIADLRDATVPVRRIADHLGRRRSTIHREIARTFHHTRNRDRRIHDWPGCYAVAAHGEAQRRRARLAKSNRRPALRRDVVAKLGDGWTPQQIAGRLAVEPDDALGRVSHETIYAMVFSKAGAQMGLAALLPRGRKRRRRRAGRKPRSPRIPEARAIQNRPKEAADRAQFGHWEGDLMIFAREHGVSNVATVIERQTRYVVLLANDDRRPKKVAGRIDETLSPLPANARRTLTLDRGFEFLAYDAEARDAQLARLENTEAAPAPPGPTPLRELERSAPTGQAPSS